MASWTRMMSMRVRPSTDAAADSVGSMPRRTGNCALRRTAHPTLSAQSPFGGLARPLVVPPVLQGQGILAGVFGEFGCCGWAGGGCPKEAGYKPAPTSGRDADGGGLAGRVGWWGLGGSLRQAQGRIYGDAARPVRQAQDRLDTNGGWAGVVARKRPVINRPLSDQTLGSAVERESISVATHRGRSQSQAVRPVWRPQRCTCDPRGDRAQDCLRLERMD